MCLCGRYHSFAPVYALLIAYVILAGVVVVCFPLYVLPSLDQAGTPPLSRLKVDGFGPQSQLVNLRKVGQPE